MKKLFSILLAAIMVCTLCVTAAAAPADLSDHTYAAFQIFSGTQNEVDPELANIEWGTDIDDAAFLAALKASTEFGMPNAFADCTTAAQVASKLEAWTDNSAAAKAFAKLAYANRIGSGTAVENGETELDAGYYLVVDTTATDEEIYNLALLQLTQKDTFTIATKVDVPEIEKKVSDASGLTCQNTGDGHSHTKECYNWAEANKVAIGDTVLFSLTGTVPVCAADYDYYYYIISDTLSDGLTFAEGSLAVAIGGEAAAEGTDYSVRFSEDGQMIQIALTDAKANAGNTVDVQYAAVLNENAIIGSIGNPNEVSITYASKPNYIYDGTENPDEPGFPAPDFEEVIPTGETPKDITLTFTTALKLYKVDQDMNPLAGAEFTLTGDGLNIVLIARDVFSADTNGSFWKLANGAYTKTAPITQDNMIPAEEGATEGYVVAESGYSGDAILIDGTTYRPYNPSTDAAMTIYTLVKNNIAAYDSITAKYTKAVVLESQAAASELHVSATVDELGIIIFQGLNAGDYTLTETVTPSRYNPIDPIAFTITCALPTTVVTGAETCTWEVESDAEISYSEENNAFEITVVNQKGSVLPETGGIGTTIFYVLGALLVVTAVVLLVVKKRMGTED